MSGIHCWLGFQWIFEWFIVWQPSTGDRATWAPLFLSCLVLWFSFSSCFLSIYVTTNFLYTSTTLGPDLCFREYHLLSICLEILNCPPGNNLSVTFTWHQWQMLSVNHIVVSLLLYILLNSLLYVWLISCMERLDCLRLRTWFWLQKTQDYL